MRHLHALTSPPLVSTLITVLAATLPAQDPKALQVDRLFEAWDKIDRAGAAVAIVRKGKIIHELACGMADLERGIRNTPKTRFQIASVSTGRSCCSSMASGSGTRSSSSGHRMARSP